MVENYVEVEVRVSDYEGSTASYVITINIETFEAVVTETSKEGWPSSPSLRLLGHSGIITKELMLKNPEVIAW